MIIRSHIRKNFIHTIPDLIYYFIFSIFCYLVIYKIYNPEILYFKLQPFFSLDPAYIEYHFHQELGYISILSEYFLQFLYYPVAGSVLLSLLLLVFTLQYRYIFNSIIKSVGRGFELIPALIILCSLKYYSITLNALILFLIINLIIIGSRLLPKGNLYPKLIYHLFSIYLLFNIIGILSAFALLMFYVLDEILFSKTPKRFLLIALDITLLTVLSFYYLGFTLISVSLKNVNPTYKYIVIPSYWHILIAYIIVASLSPFTKIRVFDSIIERVQKFIPIKWILLVVLLIFGIVYHKKLFVNGSKYKAQIEFYANEKLWSKVLEYKDKVNKQDRIPRFLLNLALYQTGQMANDLCSVPQEWGEYTLMLTKEFNKECLMHSSNFFFDMGFVKVSQYWALEAHTFQPYSPDILKRLILNSFLLNEYQISEKYLNILKHSLIYRKWASEILSEINKKNYSKLKKIFAPNDLIIFDDLLVIDNDEPNLILLQLLNKNKQSRMAFEYLMAYYLLRNDLGNFYSKLDNMVFMNYPAIPKNYQEALLIYYLKKDMPVNNYKFPVSEDIQSRFASFNKIFMENRISPDMAQRILHEKFGDTYWYYLKYVSPLSTHGSIKKIKG